MASYAYVQMYAYRLSIHSVWVGLGGFTFLAGRFTGRKKNAVYGFTVNSVEEKKNN